MCLNQSQKAKVKARETFAAWPWERANIGLFGLLASWKEARNGEQRNCLLFNSYSIQGRKKPKLTKNQTFWIKSELHGRSITAFSSQKTEETPSVVANSTGAWVKGGNSSIRQICEPPAMGAGGRGPKQQMYQFGNPSRMTEDNHAVLTAGVTDILLSLPANSQSVRRHWRNVLHNTATVIDWQIQQTEPCSETFHHQHGMHFDTKGRQKSYRVRFPCLEQWISDQKPLFSLRHFLLRSVRAIFNTASSVKCYRKGACHISQ